MPALSPPFEAFESPVSSTGGSGAIVTENEEESRARARASPDRRHQRRHPSLLELFPRRQLIEALGDLIRHWRWARVIVVYREVERIQRLAPAFLDANPNNEAATFAGTRFYFVRVENDADYLAAARRVKSIEEACSAEAAVGGVGAQAPRSSVSSASSDPTAATECSGGYSRVLVDMRPAHTHAFLMAVRKIMENA